MGTRGVTIIDVAREARVSRQTVSRALNGLPEVSESTRTRVVQAARRLNYRPNRAAQGLVRGRDVTIGLVVHDLRNPYYPELASVLSRLAAERGWGVVLCDLGPDDAAAGARLADVLRRVDAVVGSVTPALAGASLPVPFVALDVELAGPDEPAIAIDYGPGITAALDHLVARGRRRIAMVDSHRTPSRRRLLYRAHLQRHGLAWDETSEVVSSDTHLGGVAAAATLRRQCPDADAVLVFNDVIAVGVLKGLTRAGVAVPDELAVVGIDGLDIGTLVTPELTTLAIDRTELARHALELVAAALGSPTDSAPGGGRRVLVPTLVVRESS